MALTARQAISSLGNGLGYIYIRDEDGSFIFFPNNKDGVSDARIEAVKNIPLGHNIAAHGTIVIDTVSGTGDVSAVTIGGVNQISANITHTGQTATQMATAIANNMNAYDPGSPNYQAIASGDTVTIYAPASLGDSANSHTIVVTITGGTFDTTLTHPSGGASAGADTYGDDILLDADFGGTALSTSISGDAVNINSVFIPKTYNASHELILQTIASGLITFERKANITIVTLNGESGSDDDLTDITTTGFSGGDLLMLTQGGAVNTITVKSSGNISLDGSTDFVIDNNEKAIILGYNSTTNSWNEKLRSAALAITVALMRTASIPQAVSGVETIALATGGGTENRTPGTDKGFVELTGTGTLSGSWTIQGDGTPIAGDTWWINYRCTFTADGNNITIFGIALTDQQILTGSVLIKATYDGSSYRARMMLDHSIASVIENAMILNSTIASAKLVNTAVTAGTYTRSTITVNAQGQITAASSNTANGGTPLAKLLWVDTGGDDSTAVLGDIGKPWKTIETALTAATSGDTIILTPGTHNAQDILKDGVNLYFMQGAKVVYNNASGAVMKDSGATALTITISGYPYIEHGGTGSNKYSLLLSGTGAHLIEFVNAEFYGAVTEFVVKIDNANARVKFKECLFRQGSDTDIMELADFDDKKIMFQDCWFVNDNAGASADGIILGADSPVFDNCKFALTNTARFILVAAATRTIVQLTDIQSNAGTSGDVTNLNPSTALIVDSNTEFYR